MCLDDYLTLLPIGIQEVKIFKETYVKNGGRDFCWNWFSLLDCKT